MKSTITLRIEVYHDQNLPVPDAQGIADLVGASLTESLAADPLASAVAHVKDACIKGLVPMTVQAVA